MVFIEAFLWGAGISLGMCVGLVAWALLRRVVTKPTDDEWQTTNRLQLHSLQRRNSLTSDTNEYLKRIATALEPSVTSLAKETLGMMREHAALGEATSTEETEE